MGNLKIGIAIVAIIAIIFAVFFLIGQKPEYPDIQNQVAFKGNAQARVTVQEFSDFQCPACIATNPYAEVIFEQFKQVRWEFKQFPLPMHNFGEKAAEASYCSQDFGKFWEYHDELFKLNGKLDNATLIKTAEKLGINEGQFTNCLYSGKKEARVLADLQEGSSKGVNGTPTFFVNGERVEGTLLSEILKNLKLKIEAKIAEVKE